MPRRSLKKEVGVEAETEIVKEEVIGKLIPFEGRESLLPPEEENGKMKYFPRYFIKRFGDTYKLIRIFRKKSGKCSMLVSSFKPNHSKRPQDREFYLKLKKAGIPEG